MIDAALGWRALRAPARIARFGALALLIALAALSQAQAQTQTAEARLTAHDLPWLKTRVAAEGRLQPLRLKPLAPVRATAVDVLLPTPVVTPRRARGRVPMNAQQVAATLRAPLPHVKVSSPFGNRMHPVRKRRGFHYGVDYSAKHGTPIMAAQDGEVTVLGRRRDFGNHLRIDHGHGVETLYGHLQGFVPALRKGARVKRGQIIGYVGATGRATGPHLHFEVLDQGRQVDPMKLALAVPPETLLSMK